MLGEVGLKTGLPLKLRASRAQELLLACEDNGFYC